MKKIKLFKGNVPKAPVELVHNEQGVPVGIRRVQHIRSHKGIQYVYDATKGWSKISAYHTHSLLNKLFVDSGLGSIYTNKVLSEAYGL